MIRLEIVGNLGADAEIKDYNGNKFVSFRVAHSEKWVDRQTGAITTQTTWVSCSLNGDGKGLTEYLKKVLKFSFEEHQTLSNTHPRKHTKWKSG